MAIFDPELQRIVVRVVYDGPAMAGKTTNVEQLCTFFSSQRRSELFVPQRMGQRTLYFDWMHLDGGLVDGRSLRCQFVTVPGQRVLEERRARIVETADVVVFVCDSTPHGVEAARDMLLAADRKYSVARPLIVQANKQDLAGALSPDEVRDALELGSGVALTRAIACEGVGVRETAVLAVRAAANHVQRQLGEGGLEGITGRALGGEALYRELLAIDDAARETDHGRPAVLEDRRDRAAANDPPSNVERTRAKSGPNEQAYGPLYPRDRPRPTRSRDVDSAAADVESPIDPTLPSANVPSGYIWPALDGRATLAKIDSSSVQRCVVSPESGSIVLRAGGSRLATSPRHRYPSTVEGRAALLDTVRLECRLERLSPRGTVVSLQPAPDGSYWLWKVTPWLTPIDRAIAIAVASSDVDAVGGALERFGEALVAGIELAARDALLIELVPSAFAEQHARVVYLRRSIRAGREVPRFGDAFLDCADALAAWPQAVLRYATTVARGLESIQREVDLSTTGAVDSLTRAQARTTVGRVARERLLDALHGGVS